MTAGKCVRASMTARAADGSLAPGREPVENIRADVDRRACWPRPVAGRRAAHHGDRAGAGLAASWSRRMGMTDSDFDVIRAPTRPSASQGAGEPARSRHRGDAIRQSQWRRHCLGHPLGHGRRTHHRHGGAEKPRAARGALCAGHDVCRLGQGAAIALETGFLTRIALPSCAPFPLRFACEPA